MKEKTALQWILDLYNEGYEDGDILDAFSDGEWLGKNNVSQEIAEAVVNRFI